MHFSCQVEFYSLDFEASYIHPVRPGGFDFITSSHLWYHLGFSTANQDRRRFCTASWVCASASDIPPYFKSFAVSPSTCTLPENPSRTGILHDAYCIHTLRTPYSGRLRSTPSQIGAPLSLAGAASLYPCRSIWLSYGEAGSD